MTSEILAALTGGGLMAAGMVIGHWIFGRGRRYKPPKAPKAVCGCRHHYSYHDPETGQCHALVDGKAIHWDQEWGDADEWEQVQCKCRKYAGPEPLPEYYAREITP